MESTSAQRSPRHRLKWLAFWCGGGVLPVVMITMVGLLTHVELGNHGRFVDRLVIIGGLVGWFGWLIGGCLLLLTGILWIWNTRSWVRMMGVVGTYAYTCTYAAHMMLMATLAVATTVPIENVVSVNVPLPIHARWQLILLVWCMCIAQLLLGMLGMCWARSLRRT